MKMTRFAVAFAASISCCLFGCGGGGGGGGTVSPPPPAGNQEPPPPVISYAGSTQPAALDRSTAAYFASQAIGLRAISIFIESLWLDLPPVRGAISETVNGSQGGTATLVGNINQFDVGYLEVNFQSFRQGGIVANGRYIQRYRNRPSTMTGGQIYSEAGNGSLEFDDLRITAANGSFTLRGILAISGSFAERFDVDLLVTDDNTGQQIYYENAAIDFSDVTLGASNRPGVALAGTVNDSLLGSITLSTSAPFADLLFLESEATIFSHRGGKLSMDSSGVAVDLWALSRRYTGLMIDIDGDRVADEGRLVSWRELSDVPEVLPAVAAGPIANAGGHLGGYVNEPITVHGLYSHDSDGDWLTYQWRVLFRPFDSQVSIDNPGAPFFTFQTNVDGDYLFALQVSDGIDTRESTVQVTVRRSQAPRPVTTAFGALEIGEPFQVGAPILVDGGSATNDPYVGNIPDWFAEGDGNTVLTDVGDPFTRELTVDVPGSYRVQMTGNPGVGSIESSFSEVSFSIGDRMYDRVVGIASDFDGKEVIGADYNDDGLEDLIVRTTITGGSGFIVFRATGPGTWERQSAVSSGSGELALGDLNGDGRTDIATSDPNGVQYTLQAPDGSFPPSAVLGLDPVSGCTGSVPPGDVAIGDIDGDGRDDLILSRYCARDLITWSQDAGGNLGAAVAQVLNGAVYWGAFDDVNGDGRIDALLGFYDNVNPSMLYATGEPGGTFQAREQILVGNMSSAIPSVAIGDTNGDQRPDLVMLASDGLTVYEQQPDGSMTSSGLDNSLININRSYLTITDVDDDTDADFLLCDARTLYVGLRQTDGSYVYDQVGACYPAPSKQTVGIAVDVTGDGVSDLILPGEPDIANLNPRMSLLEVLVRDAKDYSRPVN